MAMHIKTREEIDIMRGSAEILSQVHGKMAAAVEPGVSTLELNSIAEKFIFEAGAKPSFKGYGGFPYAVCIAVNNEVVHCTPSEYKLKEGDIVTLDCGVYYENFHADSAFTHGVGQIEKELLHLLVAGEDALKKGIEAMRLGNFVGDIGYAVQQCVEENGFSVVRGYTGHGIGREVHEKPIVPNVGNAGSGIALKEGMVLAIEPILNVGKPDVCSKGEWRVLTKDGSCSAHFEHTVALLDGKPEQLTTFDYIKEVKKVHG